MTNVIVVHLIGAVLAFVGLFVYCIIQAFLSFKLSFTLYSTFFIICLRIILSILSAIFLLLSKINLFNRYRKGLNSSPLLYSFK